MSNQQSRSCLHCCDAVDTQPLLHSKALAGTVICYTYNLT